MSNEECNTWRYFSLIDFEVASLNKFPSHQKILGVTQLQTIEQFEGMGNRFSDTATINDATWTSNENLD